MGESPWEIGTHIFKDAVGYVDKEISPLIDRIKALEAQVEALHARGIDYRGVYASGEVYGKGDVCTHSGSLWIAHRQTDKRPPGNGWTLAVKQGGKP